MEREGEEPWVAGSEGPSQFLNYQSKKVMKQRVFNLIILDASGSMCCIRQLAVNGVNETIQTIQYAQKSHPEQEHYVSLLTFNSSELKYVYDREEARRIEEMPEKAYYPCCSTPLYDAMGDALTKLRKSVADDDAVLVTIITDGEENCSREYNGKAIKALVDELKRKHWLFTYIGANQDVEKVAATISINNTLAFEQSDAGTQCMFECERSARRRFYDRLADGLQEATGANYFEPEDSGR